MNPFSNQGSGWFQVCLSASSWEFQWTSELVSSSCYTKPTGTQNHPGGPWYLTHMNSTSLLSHSLWQEVIIPDLGSLFYVLLNERTLCYLDRCLHELTMIRQSPCPAGAPKMGNWDSLHWGASTLLLSQLTTHVIPLFVQRIVRCAHTYMWARPGPAEARTEF